ncbi:MAG: HEAT repeat domain-containing protein, partial [Balneolaceae bacterium]|nr:HEAT repeat domain-containing protein [Balneolaceae bacterium]
MFREVPLTMRPHHILIVVLTSLLAISCSPSNQVTRSSSSGQLSADQLETLTDLVQRMPASDKPEQAWVNRQILGMGPAAIHALVGMLKAPGTGNDRYARYAVNGLSKYVSQPGAEQDRSDFENILLAELQSDHPTGVKTFLMEQLELIGGAATVPVATSYLEHDDLYKPAVQLLRSIGIPAARSALLDRLQGGVDTDQQIAIITAIGDLEMQSDRVVSLLEPMADSGNQELHSAVLYALSNSGNPAAGPVIESAGAAEDRLRYARRLFTEGHTRRSAAIAR